eukprot:m51a1_g9251 putative myosin light chain kinase (1076) ;mRNA; f:17052-21592
MAAAAPRWKLFGEPLADVLRHEQRAPNRVPFVLDSCLAHVLAHNAPDPSTVASRAAAASRAQTEARSRLAALARAFSSAHAALAGDPLSTGTWTAAEALAVARHYVARLPRAAAVGEPEWALVRRVVVFCRKLASVPDHGQRVGVSESCEFWTRALCRPATDEDEAASRSLLSLVIRKGVVEQQPSVPQSPAAAADPDQRVAALERALGEATERNSSLQLALDRERLLRALAASQLKGYTGAVRAFLKCQESEEGGAAVVAVADACSVAVRSEGEEVTTHSFDLVLGPGARAHELADAAQDLARSVAEGYNCVVLSWGITGSGTRDALFGSQTEPGAAVGLLEHLRKCIHEAAEAEAETEVFASAVALSAQEHMRDLLSHDVHPSVLLQPDNNWLLKDATESRCFIDDLAKWWTVFASQTNISALEPSSHAIVSFRVSSRSTKTKELRTGRLTFISLSPAEAKTEDNAFIEGVAKGLSEGHTDVKFAARKLGCFLSSALGGNSKTVLVTCCLPDASPAATRASFELARCLETVRNHPRSNVESVQVRSLAEALRCYVTCCLPDASPAATRASFELARCLETVRNHPRSNVEAVQVRSLAEALSSCQQRCAAAESQLAELRRRAEAAGEDRAQPHLRQQQQAAPVVPPSPPASPAGRRFTHARGGSGRKSFDGSMLNLSALKKGVERLRVSIDASQEESDQAEKFRDSEGTALESPMVDITIGFPDAKPMYLSTALLNDASLRGEELRFMCSAKERRGRAIIKLRSKNDLVGETSFDLTTYSSPGVDCWLPLRGRGEIRVVLCIGASRVEIKYHLEETIGSGSTGIVYRATDRGSGKVVAIKAIDKETMDTEGLDVLEHEVGIMTRLKHQNIVELYEVISTSNHIYLIMELVDGGDLFGGIEEKGKYAEPEAAGIARQILSAVAYMKEAGVAHRDLKLENVLLTSCGTVKISDFGFSKHCQSLLMRSVVGTPSYMAPEIIAGAQYSYECDVWSVGVIVFILLSGTFPFYGHSIAELSRNVLKGKFTFDQEWDGISNEAKEFVGRALQRDQDKRPQASALLSDPWIAANAGSPSERT